MRRPSVFLQRRDSLDVAMTPMIDVVFLLLVFFVWTASFQVVEYSLPSGVADMSGTSSPLDTPPPPELDFDQLVIRVHGATFELNGQPIASLSQLRARLEQVAAVRPETPAIVHPDPDVALAAAVDAFDTALAVGLQKVALAAEAGPS